MINEEIQKIRESVDIVDVVADGINLSRAGASMRGQCPFCDSETMQFFVNRPRQFYHCFTCGASGDVFKFVQEINGVDFDEAVEIVLSRKTN